MNRLRLRLLRPITSRVQSTVGCQIDIDKCASQMCRLVDEAAQHMKAASQQLRVYETKANNLDLVTQTDRQIEKLLVEGLRSEFPNHVYIGEEGTTGTTRGEKLSDAPTWIIDPIDGTTNFVHGLNFTCISVGFWLEKQPELAICYNPLLELRFTARRKCGAFLNGARLRVSDETELERALIINELNSANYDAELLDIEIENARKLLKKTHALRSTGSGVTDLCLVAMGAADGYYEFYPHCWDMAAGVLLVREAGGIVLDPAGGEFDLMGRRVLAAATPQLCSQMVAVLGNTQIYLPRDDGV